MPNRGVIPIHTKHFCILVLTTLKTDTRLADTCRLFLCKKINIKRTEVHLLVFLINFIHLINVRNLAHVKLRTLFCV